MAVTNQFEYLRTRLTAPPACRRVAENQSEKRLSQPSDELLVGYAINEREDYAEGLTLGIQC
jgi:hypothetical protein